MPKSTIVTATQKQDGKQPEPEKPGEVYAFWQQAPPGRYVITIKRERAPKSQRQLGNVFGNIISKIVYQVNEVDYLGIDGFVKYLLDQSIPKNCKANADSVEVALRKVIRRTTPDEIKAILYSISPTLTAIGEEITLRDMDTKQASIFTDRVVNMVSGYVAISDPDKNWRKKK